MNALDLQNRLEGVGYRLQDLFNSYREIRQENEALKKENRELKQKLSNTTEEIQHFQNKDKIGKLVDDLNEGGEDNTELKKLLDKYINQIDHCIEMLKE